MSDGMQQSARNRITQWYEGEGKSHTRSRTARKVTTCFRHSSNSDKCLADLGFTPATCTSRPHLRPPARTALNSTSQSRASVNAEVLLWQSRVRMIVALVAGGAEFILQQHRILQGNALYLLEGVCGYIAVITAIALFVQKTGRAPNWAVAVTVVADILFIFGSTLVSSPPSYYDRILIFSFLVLHLTETYFGPE